MDSNVSWMSESILLLLSETVQQPENDNTTDTLSERYTSLTALFEEFAPAGVKAERGIAPIWYIIGFIGNPISAMIWMKQRMRRNNSSAIYLSALSVSDTLFLLLHLFFTLHRIWGYDDYNNTGCTIFSFLFYVPQYLSTFLVFGLTSERYVEVCQPLPEERMFTVQDAIIIVMSLIVLSATLSSAQMYIWTHSKNSEACGYREEAAINGEKSFEDVWAWSPEIFAFILVPLVAFVFNVYVLNRMFKTSHNDEIQNEISMENKTSTVTLLAVSFYLIITQPSASIVHFMKLAFPAGNVTLTVEEVRNDKTWSDYFMYVELRKIIDVLCMSHYACYIFIYCLTGRDFRREVLYLLTFNGKLPVLYRCASEKQEQNTTPTNDEKSSKAK